MAYVSATLRERQAAALNPDIVLMDIRMPGTDGIEATRRILAAGNRSRVIVMTTFDLDEYAYSGLRAGASGFLLKDAQPDELLAAIRAVAAGDAVIAPAMTRRLLRTFTRQQFPRHDAVDASGRAHRPRTRNPHCRRHRRRTPRSPSSSWYPNPRSRPTSAASCPNSVPAIASARSSLLTTQGW
jgi:DNA-binding NarL/FixJ family response regulator